MTRGAKIRKAREGRDWSLGTLAAKTGLSKTHLSRLENEEVSVKSSDWVLLRQFLELPADMPYEGGFHCRPAFSGPLCRS